MGSDGVFYQHLAGNNGREHLRSFLVKRFYKHLLAAQNPKQYWRNSGENILQDINIVNSCKHILEGYQECLRASQFTRRPRMTLQTNLSVTDVMPKPAPRLNSHFGLLSKS